MDDIRPNTLSNPGERAARARLEALMERIDSLSAADLRAAPVPQSDPETREALVILAEDAADRAGRGELLDEAREAVREAMLRRFVDYWPMLPYGSAYHSVSRTDDQAEIIAALEGAVAVAITEDLLAPSDAAALGDPGFRLLAVEPTDAPGADAARDLLPEPDYAPTAADWEEAANGDTAIDHEVADEPARRAQRLWFVAFGLFLVAVALAWGFTEGEPLVGVLAAIAAIAVTWTLAGYRSVKPD